MHASSHRFYKCLNSNEAYPSISHICSELEVFQTGSAFIVFVSMAISQAQDLAAAINPIRDPGILHHVFTYLPGNWLYLGAVCSDWKAVYARLEDQQVHSVPMYGNSKLVTCDNSTTLFSAAVASPATARLACDSGLAISPLISNFQFIIGLHADTETLAVLRELGMPISETLVKAAALSGRLLILQQLLSEQYCPRPINLSRYTARSGSISMLNWLRTQTWCVFGPSTCAGAAEGGQLVALQHLRSEGCNWDAAYIAHYAAGSGSIEVVEWLRQQGIEISAKVLAWAARCGQTAVCQHLRSTGCDWDTDACSEAVECGRLETLHWLREHGCPWDVTEVVYGASREGFTDILDYVLEQGEVLDTELLTDALNCAGACDQLQTAQWLRQHGAQWPAVLSAGEEADADQWTSESLAWARAEGCTSPTTQ
jgi:hypothetical protein